MLLSTKLSPTLGELWELEKKLFIKGTYVNGILHRIWEFAAIILLVKCGVNASLLRANLVHNLRRIHCEFVSTKYAKEPVLGTPNWVSGSLPWGANYVTMHWTIFWSWVKWECLWLFYIRYPISHYILFHAADSWVQAGIEVDICIWILFSRAWAC